MMRMRIWPFVLIALLLGGCVVDRQRGGLAEKPRRARAASMFADPSGKPLDKAKLHFQNEDYGLAEMHYRQAVEQNPNNKEAWIGLAACYDRLRRFDLAERAYGVIVKQFGYTITVHNNLGYHHYLRGNLGKAKEHFMAAYEIDPTNPFVLNNLKLVEAS